MGDNQPLRHILILDDDVDYRKLIAKHLMDMFPDTELTEYDPVAEGVPGGNYDWTPYDVMLLDYNLSLHNVTGLDILKTHAGNPAFPATIMLTGAGNEDVAIRAMKSGIHDYLRKQTLDKEQLKESILDTHAKHHAALKKKDAIEEARKAANRAAAKAFEEYKSRYESLHAAQIKRLQDELLKLRDELEQGRRALTKVEQEKREAVRSLEDIEHELLRFKQGTSRSDKDVIQNTSDRREQLNKGLEESERKQEHIEGEIQKNIWKQEQDQMKLEQIEEDLRLFNEEFGIDQDDDRELAKEFKKMQSAKQISEKADRKKKEEELLTDISSQLGEKDKK